MSTTEARASVNRAKEAVATTAAERKMHTPTLEALLALAVALEAVLLAVERGYQAIADLEDRLP